MITIRLEKPIDVAAREALLDMAYGDRRHDGASVSLREGRVPAVGLSLVAVERRCLVGTIRLWHVSAGARRPALLLGPLAVHPACRNRGIGTVLMQRAIRAARLGHRAVLLVDDAPYCGRFGFSAAKTGALRLPAPYERHRLLGLELVPGAFDGAHGLVQATGARLPSAGRDAVETDSDQAAASRAA